MSPVLQKHISIKENTLAQSGVVSPARVQASCLVQRAAWVHRVMEPGQGYRNLPNRDAPMFNHGVMLSARCKSAYPTGNIARKKCLPFLCFSPDNVPGHSFSHALCA